MAKIEQSRAKRIIRNFSRQKILVLGDIMVDKYLWGRVSRISPEAPVPVVWVGEPSVRFESDALIE